MADLPATMAEPIPGLEDRRKEIAQIALRHPELIFTDISVLEAEPGPQDSLVIPVWLTVSAEERAQCKA